LVLCDGPEFQAHETFDDSSRDRLRSRSGTLIWLAPSRSCQSVFHFFFLLRDRGSFSGGEDNGRRRGLLRRWIRLICAGWLPH